MRELAELIKGAWKIRLYRAGPSLSEMKMKATSTVPKGAQKKTMFASPAQSHSAMLDRIAELVADGWRDTGAGLPQKAPRAERGDAARATKSADALDAKFGALAKQTIAALQKSKTDASDDKIWRAAIKKYGTLKVATGGNANENVVQFFAVDGIALEVKHPVVVSAVKATDARKRRWMSLLEKA